MAAEAWLAAVASDATDMTRASLRLGQTFARDNTIGGIEFLQMNLFRPCIRPSSMGVVISNGVLHHTYDTRTAFFSIFHLVRFTASSQSTSRFSHGSTLAPASTGG